MENFKLDTNNLCSECKHSFKRFSDLRKHVKKFHMEKLDIIAPLQVKSYPFQCTYCKKNFSDKRNINMHLKTHAERNEPNSNILVGKKCPFCDFMGKYRSDFYNHFQLEHNINVEVEKCEFFSLEMFKIWFSKIEKDTQSKFILENRSTSTNAYHEKYVCHRSGFFKSKSSNIRHLKTQGTKKINGFCPAGLQVLVNNESGNYEVTFIKTHIGHQNDLCHLFLSKDQREMLATKIAMKIPFDAILDDIRDTVSEDSLERMHLLTKKDLFNIEASFNLHSSSQRHRNDAVSVDAWVEEMRDSCVLFYKPQGILLGDHPQLKQEDFVLIIMTEGQKILLRNYAKECICLDGTHGLNGYNFELHTLLVLDELRQGFPCAFCISSRSDEVAMNLFFNCIKAEVGLLSTKVFMSDMADVYYNAWIQVMEEAQYRLFCSWHVDRAWRKNLRHINLKDKQVAVYKMLRTLMQETDTDAFEKMIPEFICQLVNDPDSVEFAKYFQNYYIKNCKSWAYCYRTHSGLNTNMHIERLHKSIKYIYLRGKNVQRLDKAIGALMKLVRDHLFDRIITLNKGKICSKLKELRKRHHSSLTLETTSINEVKEGIWQISSSSGCHNTYIVCENTTICECELYCTECKTCLHKYSCDCVDCAIRWNMCKHIHLICRYIQEKERTESCIQILAATEIDDQLEVVEDVKQIQSKIIFNQVSAGQTKKPLSEKKKELIEKLLSEVNSIENDNEFIIVQQALTTIGPTLRALRYEMKPSLAQTEKKEPSNKKILTQRRLFSTKKQTKKNVRRIAKPTQTEQNEIAVNLLGIN